MGLNNVSHLLRMRFINFAVSLSSPLSVSFYICKIIYTLSPFLVALPFSFIFFISGKIFIIHKFLFHVKKKVLAPQIYFYQQKTWHPSFKGNLYSRWIIFNYPCSKSFTLLSLLLKPQPSCLAWPFIFTMDFITSWEFKFPLLNLSFWKQILSFYIIVRFSLRVMLHSNKI